MNVSTQHAPTPDPQDLWHYPRRTRKVFPNHFSIKDIPHEYVDEDGDEEDESWGEDVEAREDGHQSQLEPRELDFPPTNIIKLAHVNNNPNM